MGNGTAETGRATDQERGRPTADEDSDQADPDATVELDKSGEPIGEHRRSGRLVMGANLARKMPTDATMTEDRKLLEPTRRPDFPDTDPWRASELFPEFVEGFDALAEIGPAITVFGSVRVVEGDPAYTMAREIGRLLALEGYAVITGGGPGVMEAANRAARRAAGRPAATSSCPTNKSINSMWTSGSSSGTSSRARRCS